MKLKSLILTVLLLLPALAWGQMIRIPGPGGAAGVNTPWTHGNTCASTTSCTINASTGDLIVMTFWMPSGTTGVPSSGCSDTIGNNYTLAKSLDTARPSTIAIYWTRSSGANASNVISCSGTLGSSMERMAASTFTHTSGTYYSVDGAGCSASSASSCDVTTTVANALLVGSSDIGTSNAPGSGFSDLGGSNCNSATTVRICSEYETDLTNTIGTNSISFTSGGTNYGTIGVAFSYCSVCNSLVSYWDLTESSGVRADSIGGNSLTDNNTVTGNPGPGSHNASQFTRANSEWLSHASNSSLQPTPDVTIVTWAYFDSLSGVNPIVFKDQNNSGQRSIQLYANSTTTIGGTAIDSSGNLVSCDTTTTLSTATWYFIVYTYTASDKKCRTSISDGALTASSALTNGINSGGTDQFHIGRFSATYGALRVALTGYWHRVLTSAEVTCMKNTTNGRAFSEINAC